MSEISKHVKGMSQFQFYRAGNLYYETDSGFVFTVPISDTNEATFPAIEKSIFFMRWIRKCLAQKDEALTELVRLGQEIENNRV